jgi:hypothetical protein
MEKIKGLLITLFYGILKLVKWWIIFFVFLAIYGLVAGMLFS